MNSFLVRYSILFALFVCLCSWGEKAHRKINSSCVEFFPKELNQLKVWAPILADHGSDADFRKKDDKTEFVKHFTDIDSYDDFNRTHRIEEDFETATLKYGNEKIKKEGTLPWTTDSTYNALVQNFKSENWDQAVLTAADLGHYVGDGFMPLHITANYDGQLSTQTGIHRRYEETMIDRNIDKVQFKPFTCKKINGVKSSIFGYLYANHSYVSLLLKADNQAYIEAGDQYSDRYYESLWMESGSFTIQLLEESSKTLAGLIYTAWLEAGKPKIPAGLGN
ncbi:MAG: hypothetical protein PHP53_02715 [Prolixibacteraceae bacterium]|nr:hypothetical protein [Prolixibacteraceae bacterium]